MVSTKQVVVKFRCGTTGEETNLAMRINRCVPNTKAAQEMKKHAAAELGCRMEDVRIVDFWASVRPEVVG